MRHVNLFSLLALVGVLALGLANLSTRAEGDAPAKKAVGSISGKVVDKDGNPVAEARVYAMAKPDPTADQPKDSKKPTPKTDAVADTKTAADGTFTLTNVPEGKVRVLGTKKGLGQGVVKDVAVVAGQETKLADPITLTVKAAKTK